MPINNSNFLTTNKKENANIWMFQSEKFIAQAKMADNVL